MNEEQTAQVALLQAKIELRRKQCDLECIKLNQEISTIENQ